MSSQHSRVVLYVSRSLRSANAIFCTAYYHIPFPLNWYMLHLFSEYFLLFEIPFLLQAKGSSGVLGSLFLTVSYSCVQQIPSLSPCCITIYNKGETRNECTHLPYICILKIREINENIPNSECMLAYFISNFIQVQVDSGLF